MPEAYKPQEIEPKWQLKWEADGLHKAVIDRNKPRFFALTSSPIQRRHPYWSLVRYGAQ